MTDALYAPNPFDESDKLIGCPLCKSVNSLVQACDDHDCWDEATCGTPTDGGYRMTCGKHAPLATVAAVSIMEMFPATGLNAAVIEGL